MSESDRKVIMVEMDSVALCKIYEAAKSWCGASGLNDRDLLESLVDLREEFRRHDISDPFHHAKIRS